MRNYIPSHLPIGMGGEQVEERFPLILHKLLRSHGAKYISYGAIRTGGKGQLGCRQAGGYDSGRIMNSGEFSSLSTT